MNKGDRTGAVLLAAALAAFPVGALLADAGDEFRLLSGERPDSIQHKLRAAAEQGFEVVSAEIGAALTGRDRIVVLMQRRRDDGTSTDYRVVNSPQNFDESIDGPSVNDLAAEGYRIHPRGILGRSVGDWWLSDSEYEQVVVLMARSDPARAYEYESLVFAGPERFHSETAELHAAGFEAVGILNVGRRLRVIMERPSDRRAPPENAHGDRPYDVVIAATPRSAIRALHRGAKSGYRILGAVDQSIHAPPLVLLGGTDGAPDVEHYEFMAGVSDKVRTGKLEMRLNQKNRAGYRVVASSITETRLVLERPRIRSGELDYLVLSTKKPPGLPRAMEQATALGYRFLDMFLTADGVVALLERGDR
jgi:hypothetical protein